jgi:hypothetical protein
MGLDMYLTKRYYIGAEYEWNEITGTLELYKKNELIPIQLNEVIHIVCNGAYWRKANQIHSWFVKNVQDGEDDCKDYYVEKEKLRELLEICKQIKENPELAIEMLPTQEGFFFGSTEYDEYYMEDIDETIDQLSKLDLSNENYQFDYYYKSSW